MLQLHNSNSFGKFFLSFLLFVTISLTIPSITYATTYYVATTGSDSNTPTQAQSSGTPWLTLQHAEDTATGGDTVHVAAGTYVEDASATHGWYITKAISWIADGTVTVRGTSTNTRPLYIYGTSATNITGFTFDSELSRAYGIFFAASAANKTFTNCTVSKTTDTAIMVNANTSNIIFDGSTITTDNTGNYGINATGPLTYKNGTINFNGLYPFMDFNSGSTIILNNNITTSVAYASADNHIPIRLNSTGGTKTISGNTMNFNSLRNVVLAANGSVGSITFSGNSITVVQSKFYPVISFDLGTWTPTITSNTIHVTGANQNQSAISVTNQSGATISSNTITTDTSTSDASHIEILSTGTIINNTIIDSNTLTSNSSSRYVILLGREDPDVLEAKIIAPQVTNNIITANATSGNIHIIMCGYVQNCLVRYNKIVSAGAGYGIVLAATADNLYTTGGAFYNLLSGSMQSGIRIGGGAGSKIYNNTISINSNVYAPIYITQTETTGDPPTDIKIKNNIIVNNNSTTPIIHTDSSGLSGFETNNNVLYPSGGGIIGTISSTNYSTLAAWQAAGYDSQSVSSNPLFLDSSNSDYRLQAGSPAINLGTNLSYSRDLPNNTVPQGALPDAGAYEFLMPSSPSSLAQYKTDGSTTIAAGAFTNQSSVVFKFNLSSANSSDSLTPQVEIQPIGTAFTNTSSHTGSALAYTGSTVTGSVTVTGLESGTSYHWQARTSNSAGQSSWVALGGNPDFKVDSSSPTSGSLSSPSSYTKDNTKPTLVFKKASDADSGVSSYSVTLDSGKSRSFTTSGIPASGNGTANYLWKNDATVKITFVNENDNDSTNDEIQVYFKDLDNGELTEGKHWWSVTTTDAQSNQSTQSLDFYLDRTSPFFTDLALANISSIKADETYKLSILDRTPSFSGSAIDSYVGSTRTNGNGTTDTFDKVASGPQTITLTLKKQNDDGQYIDYLTKEYSLSNIQDKDGDKKSASFYLTVPFPLIDGYYQVQISLKDYAGNITTQPSFYLSLNNPLPKSLQNLFKGNLNTKIIDQQTTPAATEEEKNSLEENGYTVKIRVVDKHNQPVIGAKVTIHSKVQETTTDENGVAIFNSIEPGQHQVLIAYSNYEGEQNIDLSGDVKEFSYSIEVKPQSLWKNPTVIIASCVAGLIILVLVILLIQAKKKK